MNVTVPIDAIHRQIAREERVNLWQAVNVPTLTIDRISGYRSALAMNEQAIGNQVGENIRGLFKQAEHERRQRVRKIVREIVRWLIVAATAAWVWFGVMP